MLPIRNTPHFDVIIDPTKLEATKGGFDTTTNPAEAKFVGLSCIHQICAQHELSSEFERNSDKDRKTEWSKKKELPKELD